MGKAKAALLGATGLVLGGLVLAKVRRKRRESVEPAEPADVVVTEVGETIDHLREAGRHGAAAVSGGVEYVKEEVDKEGRAEVAKDIEQSAPESDRLRRVGKAWIRR